MDDEVARRRLEAERERLTGLIRGQHESVDAEQDTAPDEPDAQEQRERESGTETYEREQDLSILEGLEAELAEIEAAIARIEAGTYGVDEVTGAPIDPARLEALPQARTNVDPAAEPRRPE